MAIQYNQLVQKPVDGNMTVFNTQTGQGYSNPDQLAGDLGVDKSAIDWKAIQTNPNWSYGGVANSNQQGVIGTRDSSVSPGTQEYYNTQTGQGFANPQELSNFVNQQGGQTNATNVFDNLKQGFSKLMATPAPASLGEANMAIQQVTPPSPIDTSGIEQALQADAGYQQLIKDYQQYINTSNQNTSLLDTYKSMLESSGLNAINTEMLNTKKIIDGTEEDIRNEVTAAGGFATESQVLSLANARNKTLVKNYNALVDQANNIQNQVNTMMSFAGQDKQNALSVAMQKLNIDQQILSYRDKFVSNAREGYNNYIKAVGYSGLYNALQNNPQQLALVERTLGLPSGTIATAAAREYQEQYDKQYQQDFENQLKLANLDISRQSSAIAAGNLNLSRQKFAYDIQQKNQESQLAIDNKVANIIAANPGEWGKAATQIEQLLGQKIQTGSYYDQLLNKVYGEGQPLTNYITPQVDEKILGKIQSSPEYKTINGLLPAIQTIQDYKNSIEKYGTFEMWSGTGKGELAGNFGNALASWKTLAGLGALSGADFTLAENAIPSPGLWQKNSTAISKLNTSLKTAVDQAEMLSKRLIANYPDAAYLINSQLDQMKVIAYPEKYKVGPDGQVYEITK